MDMDDDFMGAIEFNLTPAQSEVVSEAIGLASQGGDEFQGTNPLLAIMQWWQAHVPEAEKLRSSPEGTLAEACRRFVLAHRERYR